VVASPRAEITVDLREVEEVTDEGCAVIRHVADDMDNLSQRMVVLYVPERDATRSLERTRLLDDSRIVFVASEGGEL
jgi:hypothetical protein